jgi:hypothetical protein
VIASSNRFAAPVEDLPSAGRAIAETALAAATGTFADFEMRRNRTTSALKG